MSFTRTSGVVRIGRVPSTWQVMHLKRVAVLIYGDALPSDERVEDGSVPVFGSNGQFALHDRANTEAPVIFLGRKGSCGALTWNDVPSFGIDTVYFIDDRHARGDLRWLFWALQTLGLDAMSQDTGVPGLARETAYSTMLPVPSKSEQATIADFLDRETAKIDALIVEQERLIALLKEKRQAVISHAVTKGLNPNAPMKDSGVEWLGEVPAHWDMSRLKHLSSHVVDCLHTTPTYDGDLAYPAIRTADLERGRLLLSQARLVSEAVYQDRIQRLPPRAGDIVYSREGERFGMAALVPEDTRLCLGQRMMMFRVYPHVDPAYVMWLLNSDAVYQQVLSTVGGATSPHVNIAEIINFAVPVPPLREQADIARKIEEASSGCDSLVEKSEEAISLLQERRSALVSAAVSGKIDVRGVVVAEAEAA